MDEIFSFYVWCKVNAFCLHLRTLKLNDSKENPNTNLPIVPDKVKINLSFHNPLKCMRRGGGDYVTAPCILNSGARWRKVVSFTHTPCLFPKKETTIPTEQKVGWVPGSVCKLRSRKESLAFPGIESWILGGLVPTLTTLKRIPVSSVYNENNLHCIDTALILNLFYI
jgi:hypothetical protein